jgi:hypothetical protein
MVQRYRDSIGTVFSFSTHRTEPFGGSWSVSLERVRTMLNTDPHASEILISERFCSVESERHMSIYLRNTLSTQFKLV